MAGRALAAGGALRLRMRGGFTALGRWAGGRSQRHSYGRNHTQPPSLRRLGVNA